MRLLTGYILLNAESSAGSGLAAGAEGGVPAQNNESVTLGKNEHEELKSKASRSDELTGQNKKQQEKITELGKALINLETEKEKYKTRYEGLESSVKKNYIEQLPEEHKPVAALIPTIEGLAEYVKLNGNRIKAGTDSGKPVSGGKDFTVSKWDDLSYSEKEDIRKKRPDIWKKLYREKFGQNP